MCEAEAQRVANAIASVATIMGQMGVNYAQWMSLTYQYNLANQELSAAQQALTQCQNGGGMMRVQPVLESVSDVIQSLAAPALAALPAPPAIDFRAFWNSTFDQLNHLVGVPSCQA